MKPITAEALTLLTSKGFEQKYFENLSRHTTCQAAYEATEEEYKSYFLKTKYSSWHSFKQVSNRRRRKKVRG